MKVKTAIVTGGAGFIGSNLIRKIYHKYEKIICIDNFSLGKSEFFINYLDDKKFEFFEADCSDFNLMKKIINNLEEKNYYGDLWHLAANSDIPAGVNDSSIDLKDTFMTTYSLVLSIKNSSFDSIFFASSAAIYGDHKNNFLNEKSGPLLPISNYGAMKLSSEAIISASAESDLRRSVIFRFPNVVGVPATHGVIYDFTNKLINNPKELKVLGDGTQKKSYLHVDDLIEGMINVVEKWPNKNKIDIFNIGANDDGISIREIAEIVSENFNNKNICYGKEKRGWVGDVPKFFYDISKIKKLTKWEPKMNSREAIKKASIQIYKQLLN